MTVGYSLTIRNARLNIVRDAIDAGLGPGRFRIYDGARPLTGGATTVLLGEITCSDPSANDAVNGTMVFNPLVGGAVGLASGTATWGRFIDYDENFVADCNVATAGADVTITNTNIEVGAPITVVSAIITSSNA